MASMLPSDLLDLLISGFGPDSPVAFDTETSGLYADDGARVATVSVAWADYDGEWLDFASDHKFMTWNIETIHAESNYQVPIVSVAWPFDQGVSGTGKPEDHGQGTFWADADNLDEKEWGSLLRWLFEVGKEQGLTAQNAPFDVLMMDAGCRRFTETKWLNDLITWDTQNGIAMLYPLITDPDKGNKRTIALKPASRHLFGMDVADEAKIVQRYLTKKKLPKGRWDLMPWDIIGEYADKDARLTAMQRLRQEWEIEHNAGGDWLYPFAEDRGLTGPEYVMEIMNRRTDVARLLARMEKRGLPYDEIGSRDAADRCRELAAEVAKRLPFRADINAAKAWFFTEEGLNLPAYELTKEGAVSMTAEVVDRMVNDKVPHATDWAEWNKVTNAASMWYTAYADAMGTDGRLRTRLRQNGTVSTRFSAERVNLQAIPQDYRLSSHEILTGIPTPREFIARGLVAVPGWKMWELDLAQAELRVAAMFAQCERMMQMIHDGEDLHSFTTEALFKIQQDDPNFGTMRQVGKRGNFSLIFDAGGETFWKMVRKETGIDLGLPFSEKVVRDWRRLYPEFGVAVDSHSRKVQQRQIRYKRGWVTLLNGERRWFERYEDSHKAFNQRVQGNLAQFGIDWMLASDRFLMEALLPKDRLTAGLLLTIHDSQVLLVPDTDEGEWMVQECAKIGEDLWKRWFPGVPGGVDVKEWGKK
jgi:hypothetical protein